MDGISVLKTIKSDHPVVEVILLTGHGTIDTAVDGLKSGAFDYVQKPARFEELLEKLEAARNRKSEHEGRIRRAEARSLMRQSGDI
jgi:DNA-binding NtrC family response regulator